MLTHALPACRQALELVHELLGELDLAVFLGHALQPESLAEGFQEFRAHGVVLGLFSAGAGDRREFARVFALADDIAAVNFGIVFSVTDWKLRKL